MNCSEKSCIPFVFISISLKCMLSEHSSERLRCLIRKGGKNADFIGKESLWIYIVKPRTFQELSYWSIYIGYNWTVKDEWNVTWYYSKRDVVRCLCITKEKKDANKNLILIKLSFYKDHFRKCVQWRCLDLSEACHVNEYSMVSKTIMLVLIISLMW